MKSTSIHSLSADNGLNRPLRYTWFLLNWLNNNLFENVTHHNLSIRDFVADVSDDTWSQSHTKSSPSRKLSDLFWQQLPWGRIRTQLAHINVLDTGCGSGTYGVKLQSYSKGNIATYTGIDASQHDSWSALAEAHPNYRFHRLDSGDISEHIPDETNLFISQSAIEHFKCDLQYFRQIREFVRSTSRNVIQIHLFPSTVCLKLYRLHGVRQYTPRTISYITRLFQESSRSTLYRLGGRACNQVHWEYITKPLSLEKIGDLRDTRTQEYDRRLRAAITADNDEPHLDPSFYALVIHSNWKEVIFE